MLENLKASLTALVFPDHCLQCEGALPVDTPRQWCDNCFHDLIGDEPETCLKCAAHLRQASPFELECAYCRNMAFRFDAAISIGNYRGALQTAVLDMKRSSCETTAYQFGSILGNLLLERTGDSVADLIIPMPIHWWSRLKRGYCAAAMIATGISAQTKIPINDSALRQIKKTKKQGMLSTTARFKNIRGAFSLRNPKVTQGKRILLVDDVMTSGATANEAAKVLKKAGAKHVYVAIVARGVRAS